MEDEGSLVSRRPRRSTAGNRMELALAELAIEEPQEPEEDIDFVVEKEEEDVFESDFASTDEEAVQEDLDEDRAVREEERRERKTARVRVEKATATAHARQRATFNPGATSSQPKPNLSHKSRRRVSLGVVVNAETGEVIEGSIGRVGVKRQSQRRYTILNTSATVNRIKDAEERRATIPKKTKIVTRLPTQDELIARALDTEEGNITEHKNYLRLEEEKRAKVRVVKQAIEGPVLRWVSRKETIQVEVQPPSLPPLPPTTIVTNANMYANYSFAYAPSVGPGTVGSQAYSMPFYAYMPLTAQDKGPKPQEASVPASMTAPLYSSSNPGGPSAGSSTASVSLVPQSAPPLPSTPSSGTQDPIVPTASTSSQLQQSEPLQTPLQVQLQLQTQSQPPSILFSCPLVPTTPTPTITHRTEVVCKNYVVHELSQSIPSHPSWKDTMSAMFGNHVRWEEVKVFTSKGRPLARPVRTCPITGQPAKYCDPRTNVPFANIGAYDALTRILGREYVWSSALGCYVGVSEASQRHKDSGEAEGSGRADTSTVEDVAEGEDESVDEEAEEVEERTTKRRRVADG